MRCLGLFALALPLLPLTVVAQPAAKTKAFADCAELVATLPEITLGPKSIVEDVEGGCRATNVSYGVSSYMNYSIESVTLLSPNLLATFPTGEIFEAAELDIRGARLTPVTHSALQDYILALNTVGMNLRLAYTTDPEALTSEAEIEFSAAELGRVAVKASLSDFDNTDVDIDDYSEISGTLHQLDVTLEDRGLFVAIFAPGCPQLVLRAGRRPDQCHRGHAGNGRRRPRRPPRNHPVARFSGGPRHPDPGLSPARGRLAPELCERTGPIHQGSRGRRSHRCRRNSRRCENHGDR